MKSPKRISRFTRDLWWSVRKTPGLLNRHNVRALWRQSDPDWLSKNRLDLTDEEWAAFRQATID